jgi:hypothetical protein
MYLAWSMYRWLADSADADLYGPALVAQEAQNYVNSSTADFVPLAACAPGAGSACLGAGGHSVDGLTVFRSHFTPTGVTTGCSALDNGTVQDTVEPSGETFSGIAGGNTLGGGTECGGDVGGLIYGPFGISSPSVTYATWKAGTETHGKGWELTYKNGDHFSQPADAFGANLTIICTDSTGVQTVTNTTVGFFTSSTAIYVAAPNPDTNLNIACKVIDNNITHAAATSTQDGSTYHSKHQ